MTPRSVRRAAERKAKKAARHHDQNQIAEPADSRNEPTPQHTPQPSPGKFSNEICWNPEPVADDDPNHPRYFRTSAAQRAANQANAQHSTGPTSPAGKSKSSLNAVKTALTGRTVLLPTDDAEAYERHLHAWQEDLRPVGARECDLVQSIADSTWRLRRIPGLETAVFALGHIEFADSFNDHAPHLRPSMIELQTLLTYEKQLRNLHIQEARLARRRREDLAELQQLQTERRTAQHEAEQSALALVSDQYVAAKATNQPFEPAANGFVFSTAQIEQHLARVAARPQPGAALKHAA